MMSIDLDGWARALRVETDQEALPEMQRRRASLTRAFQDLYFDVVTAVDFYQITDDGIGPSIRCAIKDLDAAVANMLLVEQAFRRHERGAV